MKYSFIENDFRGFANEEVEAIVVRDKRFVEIDYIDGRKVRYLYNRNVSERSGKSPNFPDE